MFSPQIERFFTTAPHMGLKNNKKKKAKDEYITE